MDVWATGDASFCSERDGRSRGSLTVHIGVGPIYWRSCKQPLVTLSSGEPETVTLTDTVLANLQEEIATIDHNSENIKTIRVRLKVLPSNGIHLVPSIFIFVIIWFVKVKQLRTGR